MKIVGGALEIGTIVSAGPVKYMLTTGTFAAPKQLACSFDFTGRSDFTSENGQPIELLVLVLTAADRTSTLLHFGYFDTRIWLQEEHLDAEGKSCTSCNNNQDSLVLEIPKNETAKLNVVVQGDVTTFTRNTDAVSRPFGLSSAVSAEILFGLWSFSPYGQQADLDNFQCSLTCP